MVGLIPGLEPPQDRDGILDARFADIDRLKSSFEGCVFFDVLAVLIEGRGADATELPPGQLRFQKLGRIA